MQAELELILLAIVPAAIAAVLTGMVRRNVLARGLLDVPNERSSHTVPTARGGGLAIVVTSLGAWLLLTLMGKLEIGISAALAGGGLIVAVVGWLDDRFQLSARVRLIAHVVAAVWALIWLGGVPPLQFGASAVSLGWFGHLLGVAGIVWTLNLFNFMDGIDALAASELVFVTWAGALLGIVAGVSGGVPAAAIVLGGAACGFLLWNWPPAKIFMGDVGSGFLGFAIAVLALSAARSSSLAVVTWLLLGSVFFVDATVTLLRRSARGKKVHEAHRTHAYQHLARRWGSHRSVTFLGVFLNLCWLLPWALIVSHYPERASWILLIAMGPLVIGAVLAGAGADEQPR